MRSKYFVVLKIVFLLLFCNVLLNTISCCCGPPSTYYNNTLSISDGAGGQIFMYQINMGKGEITFLRRVGPDGNSIWKPQDIRIDSSQPNGPYTDSPTELVSDGGGSFFVIWGSNDNIWINKYDMNGNTLWKNKKKVVSCHKLYRLKALSDNRGGAIICCFGRDGDFRLQITNSEGKLQWSPEKNMADIAGFDITTDSSGNILLFYVTFKRSFYLQKFELSGNKPWNAPLLIDTHHPPIESTPGWSNTQTPAFATLATIGSIRPGSGEYVTSIFSDKSGNCIVSYLHGYTISRLNMFRIDSEGDILWTKSINPPLGRLGNAISGFPTSNRIIGDNAGGLFVFWWILKGNWDENSSIIMQHIDFAGENTLPETVFEITNNAQSPDREARFSSNIDSSGNIIVVWPTVAGKDKNSNWRRILRMQIIHDGRKQLDESGFNLSNKPNLAISQPPLVKTDSSGGFVIGLGAYAWRIGPEGELIWEKLFIPDDFDKYYK